MVKRKSCRASNPAFQVQILVGLLMKNSKRKGNPIGDARPVGSRLSFTALRVRFPLLPLNFHRECVSLNMVSVVYAVGTSACDAEGMGSTPIGHPLMPSWLD